MWRVAIAPRCRLSCRANEFASTSDVIHEEEPSPLMYYQPEALPVEPCVGVNEFAEIVLRQEAD